MRKPHTKTDLSPPPYSQFSSLNDSNNTTASFFSTTSLNESLSLRRHQRGFSEDELSTTTTIPSTTSTLTSQIDYTSQNIKDSRITGLIQLEDNHLQQQHHQYNSPNHDHDNEVSVDGITIHHSTQTVSHTNGRKSTDTLSNIPLSNTPPNDSSQEMDIPLWGSNGSLNSTGLQPTVRRLVGSAPTSPLMKQGYSNMSGTVPFLHSNLPPYTEKVNDFNVKEGRGYNSSSVSTNAPTNGATPTSSLTPLTKHDPNRKISININYTNNFFGGGKGGSVFVGHPPVSTNGTDNSKTISNISPFSSSSFTYSSSSSTSSSSSSSSSSFLSQFSSFLSFSSFHYPKIHLSTLRFVFLCLLWYGSSALTNNIGKQILNEYRYPVTLTWVQFGFVAVMSIIVGHPLGWKIVKINRDALTGVIFLSGFQIVGHVLGSVAMSRVPVSFVHTIKVR